MRQYIFTYNTTNPLGIPGQFDQTMTVTANNLKDALEELKKESKSCTMPVITYTYSEEV